MRTIVPVIDLFAGPGGLGEGFSSYRPEGRINRAFKILLSVEKDVWAHQTLELRSFFRQFSREVPDSYYEYARRAITRDELFARHPVQALDARDEAMHAELGVHDELIYARLSRQLTKLPDRNWLLVGGPPCQAYSVIGRARRRASSETDVRQVLYQEYLKILARFQPAAFVMENVKGLLSSQARLDASAKPHATGPQELIFARILRDIKRPVRAVRETEPGWNRRLHLSDVTYRIYSLVVPCTDPDQIPPEDFVIRSEDYGVPQTRHRIILLGVRGDIDQRPGTLTPHPGGRIAVEDVIEGLPALRSQLSKRKDQDRDSPQSWQHAILRMREASWLHNPVGTPTPTQLKLFTNGELNDCRTQELTQSICQSMNSVLVHNCIGGEFMPGAYRRPAYRSDWYFDPRLRGVCNHISRAHMVSDLHRYMFLSCYAEVHGTSPTMWQIPPGLRPLHKNVQEWDPADPDQPFDDRFRVQVRGKPATTITCHIAKDGHYNVHYDPRQCRSLTVREAARIQTFPDNYIFEGPRTQQYQQVGNAVPPLLANQIAAIVYDLFDRIHE